MVETSGRAQSGHGPESWEGKVKGEGLLTRRGSLGQEPGVAKIVGYIEKGSWGKGSPVPRLEMSRVGGGMCQPYPVTGRD